jgi:hypothetical protein
VPTTTFLGDSRKPSYRLSCEGPATSLLAEDDSMLELRPGCEKCDVDLPPESADARICSFECTFCSACVETLGGICPNCGGGFERRPIRPAAVLDEHPASRERVYQP